MSDKNKQKDNSVNGIIDDINKKVTSKTPEERKSKIYDNMPLDKNWKPYENRPAKKHSSIRNNCKKAAKATKIKWWDMTWQYFIWKDDFETIPDNLVRLLAQKIEEWTPRRIAARVCGLAENLVEYRIEKWLHYTDKAMTEEWLVERKTYIKDVILKSEAKIEDIARQSVLIAMKKWNTKVAQEFLDKQKKEVEERFNDRAEYRQIAKDMWLSKKEYIWCLNVLNWVTQQQASINVWWCKSLNMYHYRMNPEVKEFIKIIKQSRRKELLDSVPFSKETAQASIQFALWTLIEELEKPDNTKQDIINIAKEIRNTGETMWKATYMFPKEEVIWTTNIAILAGENTTAVLNMLWQKHNTEALNITQFADDNQRNSKTTTADTSTDWWSTPTIENTMSE